MTSSLADENIPTCKAYHNTYYYSTLIPWEKIYNSYGVQIESHYFRVLCQDPSIFKIDCNLKVLLVR